MNVINAQKKDKTTNDFIHGLFLLFFTAINIII